MSIKVTFTWRYGGSVVEFCGSNSNWNDRVPMMKGSDGYFNVELTLPTSTAKVDYKFIVDGVWCHDSALPMTTDDNGNINNYVDIGALSNIALPPMIVKTNTDDESKKDKKKKSSGSPKKDSPKKEDYKNEASPLKKEEITPKKETNGSDVTTSGNSAGSGDGKKTSKEETPTKLSSLASAIKSKLGWNKDKKPTEQALPENFLYDGKVRLYDYLKTDDKWNNSRFDKKKDWKHRTDNGRVQLVTQHDGKAESLHLHVFHDFFKKSIKEDINIDLTQAKIAQIAGQNGKTGGFAWSNGGVVSGGVFPNDNELKKFKDVLDAAAAHVDL